MSGGHFDYQQHRIDDIVESIEDIIYKNGKEKPKDEFGFNVNFSEDGFYRQYPDNVIEKFKIAVEKLKEARIYTHRIDWLLSGDDGEETFMERLKEDLEKLQK